MLVAEYVKVFSRTGTHVFSSRAMCAGPTHGAIVRVSEQFAVQSRPVTASAAILYIAKQLVL
jgi:hypothetical protein